MLHAAGGCRPSVVVVVVVVAVSEHEFCGSLLRRLLPVTSTTDGRLCLSPRVLD